jgi:hypothetical protein
VHSKPNECLDAAISHFDARNERHWIFFTFHGFTPALGFGIVSIVILAVAISARYRLHLAGAWR